MVSKGILLVEDEAAIREMVQHALSRAGFETRAVADAVHADREIESRPGEGSRFSCLFPGHRVGRAEVSAEQEREAVG